MIRLWLAAGLILFVLIWFFLFRVTLVLVIVLLLVGGAWGWWEVRQLRRAMRAPRRGR